MWRDVVTSGLRDIMNYSVAGSGVHAFHVSSISPAIVLRNGGASPRSFGRAFCRHIFRGEGSSGQAPDSVASAIHCGQATRTCQIVGNVPGLRILPHFGCSCEPAGQDGVPVSPEDARPECCIPACMWSLPRANSVLSGNSCFLSFVRECPRTGVSLGEVDGCQCIIWDDPCIEVDVFVHRLRQD